MNISDFWKWLLDLFKPKPKPPTPTPTPPTPPTPVDFVAQLLKLHNDHRVSKGLHPLALDNRLKNAAQGHSDWMFVNKKMTHDQNGKTVGKRVTEAGFLWSWVGENIAAGYPDAQKVFQAWLNSSGHRANIENPNFTHVGFGMKGNYWTTVFASPAISFGLHMETEPEGLEEWRLDV